jgi:VWFA-related protein
MRLTSLLLIGRFNRLARPICFGCSLAMIAVPCRAQKDDAPLPTAPTITVHSRLVVLDVVVTDKQGKPVTDLKRDDFRVYEGTQFEPIRSFEPPSAHALPAASVSPSAVFDPAQPESFGQSPVTVLVLDQLNTHFTDSAYARRQLHDYIAAQPALLAQPTTLLTVYDNHFHPILGFTRDRDLLLKALAAAPVKNAWTLEVNGNSESGPLDRLQQSLEALVQIAQEYARIRGRKNLVWVGGGFPTPDPTSIDGDDAKEVKDTLQHVTDLLLDTRVTLYAVDPTSSAAGLTEITTIEQTNFAMAAGGLSSGDIGPFDASEDFDRLGPVTGGRVIRGRNDIAQQLASSIALGGSYYTIAYAPTGDSEAAAAFRPIRVECLRPGLTVTTREGYYPTVSQLHTSKADMADDLRTAANSTTPLNGLRVHVEPQNGTQGSYRIRVNAGDLTWSSNADGSSTAHVEVLAASFSRKGKMLGHTLRSMTAVAKPTTNVHDPHQTADFDLVLSSAKPADRMRFVVRDAATGRMGSADLP